MSNIFEAFDLPNATTWFYFSLLLAVALFFKFSRLLSVRNWDVLTLFALVPGLLLLQQPGSEWWGYLWLLCGSVYFLVRCMLDLSLVQRPVLHPNLNFGGLAWMGGSLFVCLIAVAFTRQDRQSDRVGVDPVLPLKVSEGAEMMVEKQAQANHVGYFDTKFWVGRSLAILCHLAIVAGLVVVGCRHFVDARAGMAAATFYLLLPYTAAHFGQWHHVWPMALIVWAVAWYRRPALAGLLLGLATGTVYFPLLILPVWWSFYRGRGTGRFLGATVLSCGLCLGLTGLLLWLDGDLVSSWQLLRSFSAWQPWLQPDPGTPGFWTGIQWAGAYRLPVFLACMTLVTLSAFWPAPKNLAHVLALSTAALIGLQFWYADQGGVYVLWYLPLLLMLVFRPNLRERRPQLINPETDWLFGLGRLIARLSSRWLRHPETPVLQR
jgi:hypothetical protein